MKKYYVSYRYIGNKEKEIEGFYDWILYEQNSKRFDTVELMSLNQRIVAEVIGKTNIDFDDICDVDVVILCIKELDV